MPNNFHSQSSPVAALKMFNTFNFTGIVADILGLKLMSQEVEFLTKTQGVIPSNFLPINVVAAMSKE